MQRLNRIVSHLDGSSYKHASMNNESPLEERADDVIICCAIRTPITKGSRGGFKDMFPEELLEQLFVALIKKCNIDPHLIQDICIGNALQTGSGAITSRMGQFLGNFPVSVPISAVNRLCSSGLQAVANIAAAIKAGYIDIGIGGGVESMTHYDIMASLQPDKISENVFQNENARNCLLPMGITSENVAKKFGITRTDQDKFAVESHMKAFHAQKSGLFDEEIIPIQARIKEKNGEITKKNNKQRRWN